MGEDQRHQTWQESREEDEREGPGQYQGWSVEEDEEPGQDRQKAQAEDECGRESSIGCRCKSEMGEG